ncbi:fructoselysine 6-kinase [Clostridiaceae bacterium]|nr:fructoselysine 6-kinase [Clostridiaceae bacterium]RKI15349.1 fructoselysine 6-kinase [bacterium 1XD21-70]
MKEAKIIAIGDNVVDKYLSRGKMYPGGQCVNTCVYSQMNGGVPAYLGKFGDDAVAKYNCKVLDELGIDYSHSRHFHGENGAAQVTLRDGDRVFLGSNRGGVAREHGFYFTEEDLDYIRGFDIIYTNNNSYILDDLPLLKSTGVPIAFDLSTEWNKELLDRVCPYTQIVLLSCAHLRDLDREQEMHRVAEYGVKLVVGTVGEAGSYALYEDEISYVQARRADSVLDTMGAGDSYFATLLTTLLQDDEPLFEANHAKMQMRLVRAMERGAEFAAKVCAMEGAFGYGTDIID